MKRTHFFILAFGIFAATANGQITPDGSALLDFKLDSMREVLGVKGLSASLLTPDGTYWNGTSGISSETPLVNISPDMSFAIASVSKTFTAALVHKLNEAGELSLNDSIYQYLPNFSNVDSTITLLQLLQHRSGLNDFINHPNFNSAMGSSILSLWTPAEIITSFQPSTSIEPGTQFRYSNSNYLLLGMVVEAVTGQPFHQVANEMIKTPLGLNTFRLFPSESISASNPAHLWLDITGDGIGDDASAVFSNWYALFSAMSFAGGYYARPDQCARWIKEFGSGSFFESETNELIQNTLQTNLPFSTEYGTGSMSRNFGEYAGIGHGGDISFSTLAFYVASLDVSLSLHCNDFEISSWDLSTTFRVLLETYDAAETSLSADEVSVHEVRLYPNPCTSFLRIESTQKPIEGIRILTIGGATVAKYAPTIGEEILISTEGFKEGFYLVELNLGGGKMQTLKLIKSN